MRPARAFRRAWAHGRPSPRAPAPWLLAVVALASASFAPLAEPGTGEHARTRLHVINAHLAQVPRDYAFLAGDSHAELIEPSAGLCGRPIVNGGIAGARAGSYRLLSANLRFRSPPAQVIVSLGANDLFRRRRPDLPQHLARYEDDMAALVRTFQRSGADVFVLAPPPVAEAVAAGFDVETEALYTQRLRTLCRGLGCGVIDPYASLRTAAAGLADPDALGDGYHLRDYRPVLRAIEASVCPGQRERDNLPSPLQ